jgi:hypothetical protein
VKNLSAPIACSFLEEMGGITMTEESDKPSAGPRFGSGTS